MSQPIPSAFLGLKPLTTRNILASIGLHLETLQRLSGLSGAKAADAAYALLTKGTVLCNSALDCTTSADNIAHRCPVDLVQTARKMNITIKPENVSSRDAFADKVSLVRGALAAVGSKIVLNRFGKPEEMQVGRRGDRLLVM